MEYYHIQQLTDGSKPRDTLEFKFDSLMDIAEHFFIDDRLEMKKSLEEILYDRLKNLISEYEARVVKLKNTAANLSNY